MGKIRKYCLILIFTICCLPSMLTFAQASDTLSANEDEVAVRDSSSEMPRVKIRLTPLLTDKKFFLGENEINIPEMNPNYLSLEQDAAPQEKSLEEMKLELSTYLEQRRDLLPDYNLGKFGQYLKYASFTSAVILAIMHVSKYGFK